MMGTADYASACLQRMNAEALIPVILCGGSGTRLWPLSRGLHPKQFLKLLGERSLFLDTVLRARALPEAKSLLVVGNVAHRFLILDELAEVGTGTAQILLEPVGRNTAPALAAAANYVSRSRPEAILFAMPADHRITDQEQFASAVERGIRAAQQGAMVVFGVTPTQAHTGYGYIRKGESINTDGAFRVKQFKEKPDAETAASYLASGEYLWNSGMFLVRADMYLQELEKYAPDIAEAAAAATGHAEQDGVFVRVNRGDYERCRSESIDYAVMEHSTNGVVVTLDAGWTDLGSWSSLREAAGCGAAENVTRGDVLLQDVTGSVVHSSGRLVAAVGLHDQVIVETADAVFVAPMARTQEVKQLVATLHERGREEAESHLRVYRPWGWYEGLARDERMQVKRIQVKPGASLSLQLHHHRAEHWVVVHGEAEVTRGNEVFALHENQSTYIPPETKHRLRNNGSQALEIIEVQTGSYVGEDDIVRFEDNYGRANKNTTT